MRKTIAAALVIALLAPALAGCEPRNDQPPPTNCAATSIQRACMEGNSRLGDGGVWRDFSALQVPQGGIDFNNREPYPDRRRYRTREPRRIHFFATWAPSPWEPLRISYGDYNALVHTSKGRAPFDATLTMSSGDVAELYAGWPGRKRPTDDAILMCAILLWVPPGDGEEGRWVLVRDQPRRDLPPALKNIYLGSFMFSTKGECLATLLIP